MEEIIKRKKTMLAKEQASASVDQGTNKEGDTINRASSLRPNSINFGGTVPNTIETLNSENGSQVELTAEQLK